DGYFRAELKPHLTNGRGGRLVPWHPVFLSLVILPGFALAGFRGAGITMILFMSLSALFVFLILRRFASEKMAALVTLFFFFTYPVLAYSFRIYPEVFIVFLLSLGIWACMRFKESNKDGYLVLAGLCASLFPLLHPKFILLTLAVALLAFLVARERLRKLLYFFAPAGAALVFLVLWTYYLYGPNIVRGLTMTGEAGRFFGEGSPWGVFGLYIDRVWGLLPYAPLYLLLFAGMPLPHERRDFKKWWVFIPATVLVYTLVVGSFKEWHGGTSPVPRYLIPLIPLLVMCAALAFFNAKRLSTRLVIAVLALFQLVLTVFTMIYPVAAYGLPASSNTLYRYFFGNNWFSSTLERMFPLFHPVTPSSIVLLLLWTVFIVFFIYGRRWYLESSPQDVLAAEAAAEFRGSRGSPGGSL
ncbi:MAG: glycosyltransferase family 39 protein, partial [Actinobacteria bacterium]|nr:glycosyltransferase family 39 protein [Actinomycetota bacterium]